MPPRIARDPIDNDELLITAIDTGDAPLIENLLSGAYDVLRFESGVHRVQRVPATESQGRVHTSTVAVLVCIFST